MPRFVNTLILALAAIIIALPISIAFGIYLARPGSRLRELSLSISERVAWRPSRSSSSASC